MDEYKRCVRISYPSFMFFRIILKLILSLINLCLSIRSYTLVILFNFKPYAIPSCYLYHLKQHLSYSSSINLYTTYLNLFLFLRYVILFNSLSFFINYIRRKQNN